MILRQTLRQRICPNVTSILLAGTALVTVAAWSSASLSLESLSSESLSSEGLAAVQNRPIVMAQAPAPESADKEKDKRPPQKGEAPKAQPPKAQAPKAPPPAAQAPKAQPPAAQAPKPQAPAAQAPRPQPAPSAQQQAPAKSEAKPEAPPKAAQERREDRRDQRRDDRANDRRPDQKKEMPAAQQQQKQQQPPQPAPSTAQQPAQKTAPSTAQQPEQKAAPSTAQQPEQKPAPSTAQQPAQKGAPAPATAQQPEQKSAPATAQQPRRGQPSPTAQQPGAQPAPAAQSSAPAAAPPPPTQTRNASEFMRRDGKPSERKIDEVRKERKETREGNRVVIREGDRTIIREDNRTFIRHNESSRFTINARNVRTERRGANTETIVERGNGVRIVSVMAPDGRLIRRLRRDRNGRDFVIIDNSFAGALAVNMFIQLAAPVIRIPRERYIVEMRRARPDDIYGVFIAPPVEPILERYTLEQVRYNAPLRDRMPRVDLDVTFETGSWQLSPEQVDRLSVIAEGLNRAIQKNPREVFMVEGYTDAVGSDDDNLSLSDRRAEAVAVALTEQFQVPPENLVTQGYGEQYLKVPTDGPEEANRRVAVRRITPLMEQQARSTGAR